MTFKYIDNSKLTRTELIDLIVSEHVKGNKPFTYEKQLRLLDKVSEDNSKEYYRQLKMYINEQVTAQLSEV